LSKALKKNILIARELFSSPIGVFFQENDCELFSEFSSEKDYVFAVDAICPEVLNLPRLITDKSKELPAKLTPLVRAYINTENFSYPQAKKVLTDYFIETRDFDLVERYSSDFKNIYTLKIHDYLNIGFFIDSIVVDAYKAGFDVNAVREYLNKALSYAVKKVEKSRVHTPVDLAYSHNKHSLAMRMIFQSEHFEGPQEISMEEFSKGVNFFDVTFFRKKKQIIFSSLMFKDEAMKNVQATFFTEIASRAHRPDNASSSSLDLALEVKERIMYEPEKSVAEKVAQSGRITLARKFAMFIAKYRETEEDPKNIIGLDVYDVEEYLGFYPNQEVTLSLDTETKNLILRILQDDTLFSGIGEEVQRISKSGIDDQVDDFQRVFGQKTLSDVEDIFIIRGSQQDSVSDHLKVKSWIGDRADLSDNEKWEIKRTKIKSKIELEAKKIFSEGRSVVVDDLINVVTGELKADVEDVKKIVNVIIEEVVTNDLVLSKKLEDAFEQKILSTPRVDHDREKMEAQIQKMKKVILHLKNEVVKAQTPIIVDKTLPPSETDDTVRLRGALIKSINVIKAKDRSIERMKEEFEVSSRNKDYKIDTLEIRIENMQKEMLKQRDLSNEERAIEVEAENRNLVARLEVANKKIENISHNFDNHENEVIAKKDREIDVLKTSISKTQSIIERFKQDRIQYEARIEELQTNYTKLKEEQQSSNPVALKQDLMDRDSIIQSLSNEKKLFDERLRAQGLELKKAEQKLKFVTSQMESLSKKKGNSTKGSEAHTKQIEQLTNRAAEITADLSEKKKEIHKLKQENFVMSSKMAELEKKLSYLDKKAS
jgi:hypothetical protein